MITVWFTTGDLAASAKFKAKTWEISTSGRLFLWDALESKAVAAFEKGVWMYVAQTDSEVEKE